MAHRVILAATLLLIAAVGCRECSTRGASPQAGLVFTLTPGGVPVHYPTWLHEDDRRAAESAIDAAGVPTGWTVQVTVPAFPNPNNPAQLLSGCTWLDWKHIQVGIRGCEAEPILPWLAHEVQHALHPEDEAFGH